MTLLIKTAAGAYYLAASASAQSASEARDPSRLSPSRGAEVGRGRSASRPRPGCRLIHASKNASCRCSARRRSTCRRGSDICT